MDLVDYRRFKNKVALIDENDASITYDALEKRVSALSKEFDFERGLILLECENECNAVVCYLAALKAKIPIFLVNPKDETNIKSILSTYPVTYHYAKRSGTWTLIKTERHIQFSPHDDLAVILSTSGSTGNSKQIKLSFENIYSNAKSIAQYLNIKEDDRAITTLPFNYSYGLSVINSHLVSGGSILLSELSVTESEFWEKFDQHQCTSFAGVPYIYELLERTNFSNLNLPSLRYFTQAGGRLAAEKVKFFTQLATKNAAQFFVMYGQTEATARMAYLPPEYAMEYPDSIGVVIPGGSFSLLDEEGNSIQSPHTNGELVYSGPNVMMGYATQAADLSSGKVVDFLRTGDIAQVNEHGIYKITGRLNRFIKPFGIRLGLDELEKTLEIAGLNCICTGNDEELLIVVPHRDLEVRARTISAQLTRLPDSAIRVVTLVDIPRLSNGKTDYSTLQQLFPKDSSISVHEGKTTSEILMQIFKQRLNTETINPEHTFKTLGGGSLSYVQTSIDLEKALGFIPANWENISIDKLSKLRHKSKKSRYVSPLETSSALRGYSILAVVINHAGISFLSGGAALLLLVSGLNLLRFQWDTIINGNLKPFVTSMVVNVLIPYWSILILIPVLKGESINIYAISLIFNIVPEAGNAPLPAWFICALVQSILISTFPLLSQSIRTWAKDNIFQYAIYILLVGIVLRILDGYYDIGELYNLEGGRITSVYWVFALGFLGFSANSIKHKVIATLLTILLPTAFFSEDYPRLATLAIGGSMLIWLPSISMPTFLKPVIATIGAASLFIYMLHLRAPINSFTADWNVDVVRIVVGLGLGILGWKVYEVALKFASNIPILNKLFGK